MCANGVTWYQIHRYDNTNSNNPNLVYEEFLEILDHDFNECFPKIKLSKIKVPLEKNG